MNGGGNYTLEEGRTVQDNLYVAAGNVTVSGRVNGDVVLAGGNILTTGIVQKDPMLAGGSIFVFGKVFEDARIAGGTITIDTPIEGDLLAAGGSIVLLPNTFVKGSTGLIGGHVEILGAINGNLKIRAEEVIIDGAVNGNLDIIARKITFGDNAVITGSVLYQSENKAVISDNARILNTITFKKGSLFSINFIHLFISIFSISLGLMLLTALVSALVIALLFKNTTKTIIVESSKQYWKHIFIGGSALVLMPIAIVILLGTLIGSTLAFLLAGIFVISLILAKIFSGIFFGAWIFKIIFHKKKIESHVTWQVAVIGVLSINILLLVQFIGWIIGFIFFLITLGTLASLFYTKILKNKNR